MKNPKSRNFPVAFLRMTWLALGIGWLASLNAAADQSAAETKLPPNMDVRAAARAPDVRNKGAATNKVEALKASRRQAMAKGLAKMKARVPGLKIKPSESHGGVEMISANGSLSDAAPGLPAEEIVREFLRVHAAIYGLEPVDLDNLVYLGESVNRISGLRMVRVVQKVNGLTVFQSETRFTLDRDGRIIRSVGAMMPDASAVAPPAVPVVTAGDALVAAMTETGIPMVSSEVAPSGTQTRAGKTLLTTTNKQISGEVVSEMVYFPMRAGVMVPAWSQIVPTTDTGTWYTLVDAITGKLLWRKQLSEHASAHEARFQVYVQADKKTPTDSPSPLSPSTVVLGSGAQPPSVSSSVVKMSEVQDVDASPDGWIKDGGTTTQGNNVNAYLDRDNEDGPNTSPQSKLDGNGRPTGNPDANGRNRDFLGTAPRNFTMSPAPSGGDPDAGQDPDGPGNNGTTPADAFRRGLVTQLFYTSNWYHDTLYALGFDEAAGNFQKDNFGRGGAGEDEVQAEAQDGGGTDNANFATPPDGEPGRMQMYLFTGPAVARDGSLDAEIVVHELTHGLSNRLVGNGAGLNWGVGGGLGEGWSDFYALALLNNTNADDPDGLYAAGGYATYKLSDLTDNYFYGIRRFPYTTDNEISPLTWADVDDSTYDESGGVASSPLGFGSYGAGETHAMGEIWALSLWEMRSRIIADPAGANGDVPTGNMTALAIVTDGMKMTPASPSFVEARDALLAADAAANASRNERWIWEGFADRGLGYKAAAPFSRMGGLSQGHIGIGESFDIPYLDVAGVTIQDTVLGNGNGALDPGETVDFVVKLLNPWESPDYGVLSATATLATTTPGITIGKATATYPAIPAGSTIDGTAFRVTIPPSATAGTALNFKITTTSIKLGTKSVEFTQRIGKRVGLGTPIVFTRTIPGGLPIPKGSSAGIVDRFTVTADLEIADIDFRVDSLTHESPGQISIMLKGPNGMGTDLITGIGSMAAGFSAGANLINTVIDDEATRDLLLAEEADAPYTGRWKPVFNSIEWDAFGLDHDPNSLLGRFEEQSSKGEWTLLISDDSFYSEGILNGWSLIITPARYEILPFVGVPDILIEQPAGVEIAAGSTKDFGNTVMGTPKSLSFTVKNSGTANLVGLSASVTGTDAAMFTPGFTAPLSLAPGASFLFTVTFNPTSTGAKTATLNIVSNDPNESPFAINLTGSSSAPPPDTPEIAVQQPAGTGVPDGGTKSFGNVAVGSSRVLEFTVFSQGTADLSGLSLSITGPDASMYTVATPLAATTVAPGGTTTFSVRFTPSKSGGCIAALQLANNDANENPYDIALNGAGLAAPEIQVGTLSNINLTSGAALHVGDVAVGATTSITFNVTNVGDASLDGLGVTFDGPDALLFNVTSEATAPLAPTGTTAFTIRFHPTSPGPRKATMSIASNDADENPFDIALTGYRYTALEDWRKSHFGVTNNTSVAANTADDDGDGIQNIVEFAFGLDPDADSRGQLPKARMSGDNLMVSFDQPGGVEGITYGAAWTTTLPPSPGTAVPDTGTAPTHTFMVPIGINSHIYLHLTITEP